MTPPPSPTKPAIGIFGKILSETPEQKRQRILSTYRKCGGRSVVEVKGEADPQNLQAWFRSKVSAELQ